MLSVMQTAIPILIGTKFDDFAQIPLDMQWAIVTEVISEQTSNLLLQFFQILEWGIWKYAINYLFMNREYVSIKIINIGYLLEEQQRTNQDPLIQQKVMENA